MMTDEGAGCNLISIDSGHCLVPAESHRSHLGHILVTTWKHKLLPRFRGLCETKAETSKLLNELGLNSSSLTDRSLKELKGWIKAGSDPRDYEIGVDQKETYHCKFSAYIKSRKESPRGFGTLMQIFMATAYAGKRLKMSGSAKSEGVEDWAGFWLRVDGPDKKSLSFDNMQDGPLRERRLGQNLKSCWTFQIIASILHSECY